MEMKNINDSSTSVLTQIKNKKPGDVIKLEDWNMLVSEIEKLWKEINELKIK